MSSNSPMRLSHPQHPCPTFERARMRVLEFLGAEIGIEVVRSGSLQIRERESENTIIEIVPRLLLVGLTSEATTLRKGGKIPYIPS